MLYLGEFKTVFLTLTQLWGWSYGSTQEMHSSIQSSCKRHIFFKSAGWMPQCSAVPTSFSWSSGLRSDTTSISHCFVVSINCSKVQESKHTTTRHISASCPCPLPPLLERQVWLWGLRSKCSSSLYVP